MYNGYKNYQTWACHLWITDTPESGKLWRQIANEMEPYDAEKQLKDFLVSRADDTTPNAGLMADLLKNAVEEIDVQEVIEKLKE